MKAQAKKPEPKAAEKKPAKAVKGGKKPEVVEDEVEAKPKKPKKVKPGSALVVVESPAKARTINKYLGANYIVKASVGHVRDLPKSKIGVDLDEGTFEPVYEVIEGKKKVLGEIRKAAREVETV
ncbi:MAG: DNA topoisomerase I, partial [Deltaproteobacteria bacterium]|nr:DNA topoisomerase I [Deltaproteobacteria bacterium]